MATNPRMWALPALIDQEKHDDRVWLSKHCWWAMRNSKKVSTFPAHGEDKFAMNTEGSLDEEFGNLPASAFASKAFFGKFDD